MNVIILNSQETSLPAGYAAFHVNSTHQIKDVALELKHQHIKAAVLNTSAEAVLTAYSSGLAVLNSKFEFMYSVQDSRNTNQISDVFYTVNQMRVRALIESIVDARDAEANIPKITREIEKLADFMGEDTLSDIIKSSSKSADIADHVCGAIRSSRTAFEARVSNMIFPAQALEIDNKTFEPSGFIVNASEMGTSKSESNMKIFDKAIAENRKPMLFMPNIALTNQFAMRDEHYKNLCDDAGKQIIKNGAITTMNSARLFTHAHLIKDDEVKIFDEAIKLFEHMNGNAFFNGSIEDKKSGFEFVFNQMKAEDVIVSDAHFGQAYIDILNSVVDRDIKAVAMPRGRYSNIKTFAGNLKIEDLIQKAKNAFTAKEVFVFYSDRDLEKSTAIYKELAEFGNKKGMKSIMLDAASIANDEAAGKASVNPDDELVDYNMIFITPAIGPGFSARLPETKKVFMDCCGTISPISLIQTSYRFRCVEEIHLAFSIKKGPAPLPETRTDVCYRAIESSVFEDASTGFTDMISAITEKHAKLMKNPALCAAFDFKALENWSRNRYKRFTITAMRLLGFDMQLDFTDIDRVAVQKGKLKSKINAEKDATKSVFLSNDFISDKAAEEYSKKEKAASLSLDEQRLLEKHKAGKAMGITEAFTESDYEFVEKGGLNVIANLAFANNQKPSNLTLDTFCKVQITNDIHNYIISESSKKDGFHNESLVQFIQKMRTEKLQYNGKQTTKLTLLRNLFMLHIDTKDAKKAVGVMVRLLGFKLKTTCSSKVKVGDERRNAVVLNSTLHDQAIAYMTRTATDDSAINEWTQLFAS